MVICEKSKSYGFNPLIINELMEKTKSSKFKVLEVSFHSIDRFGNYCLRVILEGGRKNFTLNVSPQKLKRTRRDTLLRDILGN
jgi:hypothetical protein